MLGGYAVAGARSVGGGRRGCVLEAVDYGIELGEVRGRAAHGRAACDANFRGARGRARGRGGTGCWGAGRFDGVGDQAPSC